MCSDKQLAANRENARKSTGPRTPSGKAASARNALKHGLTAQCCLLPGEDPAELDEIRADLYQHYKPASRADCMTLEELAGVAHRLRRIRVIIDANLQIEIERVRLAGTFIDPAPELLWAQAYRNLCDGSSFLKTANREHNALLRAYSQLSKFLSSRPGPSTNPEALNPVPVTPEHDELRNEPISDPHPEQIKPAQARAPFIIRFVGAAPQPEIAIAAGMVRRLWTVPGQECAAASGAALTS